MMVCTFAMQRISVITQLVQLAYQLSLHSRWQLSRNGLNIFIQTVTPLTTIHFAVI